MNPNAPTIVTLPSGHLVIHMEKEMLDIMLPGSSEPPLYSIVNQLISASLREFYRVRHYEGPEHWLEEAKAFMAVQRKPRYVWQKTMLTLMNLVAVYNLGGYQAVKPTLIELNGRFYVKPKPVKRSGRKRKYKPRRGLQVHDGATNY